MMLGNNASVGYVLYTSICHSLKQVGRWVLHWMSGHIRSDEIMNQCNLMVVLVAPFDV